jgi:hypothetical protein
MSLYIQQLAKLIGNQLGRLYRHFGANSDGAAWFLICTSLISQHSTKPQFKGREGFNSEPTFPDRPNILLSTPPLLFSLAEHLKAEKYRCK